MSGRWRWEYDPDRAHVAGGIRPEFVKEVERLADELVELADVGVDVREQGMGRYADGLRTMMTAGGWFKFLVDPPYELIIVTQITPPYEDL